MIRDTVSRYDLDLWVSAQVANLIIDGDTWYTVRPDGDWGYEENL